jgi:hypothetical protein
VEYLKRLKEEDNTLEEELKNMFEFFGGMKSSHKENMIRVQENQSY